MRGTGTQSRGHVRVPFVDLRSLDGRLERQILDDIGRLVESAAFVNGPQVNEFEQAFASYCGGRHCVGVSSGLDALRLGLIAAGVEPGEEVVVPAATFVATVEAVTQAGAVPVLADISERDYCTRYRRGRGSRRRQDARSPSGSPVRTARRHRGSRGPRETARARSSRGRLPGTWGGARRTARGKLRPRRRFQLLSHQEPRRVRGRGRARHELSRAG